MVRDGSLEIEAALARPWLHALLARCAVLGALVLALACAGVARAQIPDELAGRRIVQIDVLVEDSPASASVAGIELGTPLTRALLRRTSTALLASGEWADVQIDAASSVDGVVLTLRLLPRIVLTRVDLRGNSALDDTTIRGVLRLAAGDEVERSQLDELRAELKEAYAQRGYDHAVVSLTLRDTDLASRKVLRVEVTEGEPVRLARVEFEGDVPPPEGDARGAIGLGDGDVLDRRRLADGTRAAEARLRERGWLAATLGPPSIELEDDTRAVVRVRCRLGRRYRTEITGFAPLSRGDVEGVLALSEERLSRASLRGLEQRVVDLYQRHGFHHARVRARRLRDPELEDEEHGVLHVAIEPGTALRVVAISFPGATHFPSSRLEAEVHSYLEEDLPRSVPFSPVDSDAIDRMGLSGRSATERRAVRAPHEDVPALVWYAPTYQEAVVHLEELYRADGYLDARVGPAEMRELPDTELAIVTVPVYEGPRTLLYDVRVRGEEILGEHELLEAAGLTRGAPFSHLALEDARRRVRERYEERGHLFATVDGSVRFSPDRERAEVTLEIVERFPVHFGSIRVQGTSATDPGIVRDLLAFHEGDLFTPAAVRASEEALLALGIFSTVDISPLDPDLAERVKPVVVQVAERMPQSLSLSAGVGNADGVRAALEYTYRNLFGVGLTLGFRAQLAYQFFFFDEQLAERIASLSLQDRLERRVTLSLGIPYVPGLRGVRASLDLSHVRDNYRDFGLDQNGIVLGFTWQPQRRFTLSVSGELEQNDVGLFVDAESIQDYLASNPDDFQAQRVLRVPQGESAITSVRVSATVDLRDSAFNPTSGVFASASVEYAHTLPPDRADAYGHFMKLSGTVSGYVPITEGWTLALQVRAGRIIQLESQSHTYPNRAFYMGGIDTLRGFLQDQVLPQDLVDLIDASARRRFEDPDIDVRVTPNSVVRAADLAYLARAELRFPITGDFYGGVFADLGNSWANPDTVQLTRIRVSAGLGLRLATPVGPLALDYGFNLTRREDIGEPFGAFHFSIGLF